MPFIRRLLCLAWFAAIGLATLASAVADEADFASPVSSEDPLARGFSMVSARSGNFEVLAPDALSANFAAATGTVLMHRLERTLPAISKPPAIVFMHLDPPEAYPHTTPFVARWHPDGSVNIHLRWGPETKRADLERALAQGFLLRLFVTHGAEPADLPVWIEVAMQHVARAQVVSTHRLHLADELRARRPMRLQAILSRERSEQTTLQFEANAYWLFRFLEREGRGRGLFDNFVLRLSRGDGFGEAIRAAYGDRFRAWHEAELWWLVGVSDMIEQPRSPVYSTADSANRMHELSRFSIHDGVDERRIMPEELWDWRANRNVREEMARRLRLIEIELQSVHPFYHNAYISIGRLFEAILAENADLKTQALGEWRADMRIALEMAEETAALLDDFCAEVSSEY